MGLVHGLYELWERGVNPTHNSSMQTIMGKGLQRPTADMINMYFFLFTSPSAP